MTRRRLLEAVLAIASVSLVFALWWFRAHETVPRCVTRIESVTIRGTSLRGLAEPGETWFAAYGYYSCRVPERGEIVLHDWAGNSAPVAKLIKAVPGDRLGFIEAAGPEGGTTLSINGVVAKTSQGDPYRFEPSEQRLLALYLEDFGSLVPDDTFLLLSNRVSGTIDSRRFGFVRGTQLLARMYPKRPG